MRLSAAYVVRLLSFWWPRSKSTRLSRVIPAGARASFLERLCRMRRYAAPHGIQCPRGVGRGPGADLRMEAHVDGLYTISEMAQKSFISFINEHSDIGSLLPMHIDVNCTRRAAR